MILVLGERVPRQPGFVRIATVSISVPILQSNCSNMTQINHIDNRSGYRSERLLSHILVQKELKGRDPTPCVQLC